MPRHVITMIAVVGAFFGLLWFGVVVLGQSGGEAMLASLVTLLLLGFGVSFSLSTRRGEKQNRE